MLKHLRDTYEQLKEAERILAQKKEQLGKTFVEKNVDFTDDIKQATELNKHYDDEIGVLKEELSVLTMSIPTEQRELMLKEEECSVITGQLEAAYDEVCENNHQLEQSLKEAKKLCRTQQKKLSTNKTNYDVTQNAIIKLRSATSQLNERYKKGQLQLTAVSNELNEPLEHFVAHSNTPHQQSPVAADSILEALERVYDGASILTGVAPFYSPAREDKKDSVAASPIVDFGY